MNRNTYNRCWEHPRSFSPMKQSFSRRNFVQSGALLAAACAASSAVPSLAEASAPAGKPSPIHLGLASYTFRNFSRAQLIGFMKQLNVIGLNAKDVKDHLPMDPRSEERRVGKERRSR